MKKLLVLILAFLMILPIFASCNAPKADGNATTTVSGDIITTAKPSDNTTEAPSSGGTSTPATESTTIPAATTAEKEIAEIPEDAYYPGVTFNVLSRVGVITTDWGNYDIIYNEESEIVVTEIGNAIKTRNETIYDKLGVDIAQLKGGYAEASTAMRTGTHEYDMVILPVDDALKLAQTGKLYATSELEYMDTTKSWYDQTAMEQFKIKGKNYYFFSDITVTEEDTTFIFYFNHDIIEARDLEKPYDLLANNQWTLDKLISMSEAATDNTSIADKASAWGITSHQDLLGAIYFGTGENIAVSNGNTFELTINSDRLLGVMEKIIKIRPYYARWTFNNYTKSGTFVYEQGESYLDMLDLYTKGNILFMGENLCASRDLYQYDVEMHIGILPCPMFDDTQDKYYTTVHDLAGITCLPATDPENAERTSVIVEFWASESQKTLVPAYYDQAQKSRFAKDDITPALLDLIFEARTYDIGKSYAWNDIYNRFVALLYDGSTDFSSMYKKYEKSTGILIKNALKAFPD